MVLNLIPEAEKEASYQQIAQLSLYGQLILLVYGLEIKLTLILEVFVLQGVSMALQQTSKIVGSNLYHRNPCIFPKEIEKIVISILQSTQGVQMGIRSLAVTELTAIALLYIPNVVEKGSCLNRPDNQLCRSLGLMCRSLGMSCRSFGQLTICMKH